MSQVHQPNRKCTNQVEIQDCLVGAVETTAPPEVCLWLVQFLLWQAAKPSGDSYTPWVGSVGMTGMPYPPNLCASVSSVGGS